MITKPSPMSRICIVHPDGRVFEIASPSFEITQHVGDHYPAQVRSELRAGIASLTIMRPMKEVVVKKTVEYMLHVVVVTEVNGVKRRASQVVSTVLPLEAAGSLDLNAVAEGLVNECTEEVSGDENE